MLWLCKVPEGRGYQSLIRLCHRAGMLASPVSLLRAQRDKVGGKSGGSSS